jgi:DNA-binding Xre family transcriptional regulator
MKTGKLIEAIMQYKHIGIEELAQKIDMAQPNLSSLIIGNRKNYSATCQENRQSS